MKKFDFRSMAIGFAIAIFGAAAVFTVNASSQISSASFAATRVFFYGNEVLLKNPLVSIVTEGETDARLYMPLRELLEYMDFIVEWDGQNDSVNLTMRDSQESGGYAQTEADERALAIITMSGTWGPEIDLLIPQMSPDAVYEMVSIFLDRQLFPGITPPTAARTTANRIENALEHMNEADRKSILDRLAAFY